MLNEKKVKPNTRVDKSNATVGLRVVRGKDWEWGDQDTFRGQQMVGTIVEKMDYYPLNKDSDWVKVSWDNIHGNNSYRIGEGGQYDLYLAEEQSIETPILEEIEVNVPTEVVEPVKKQPETVKEWLETLPSRPRKKALKNLDEDSSEIKVKSLSSALCEAFTWGDTSEGKDYWANQYEKSIN